MQALTELGTEIGNRRRHLGLKQREVASSAGISPELLSRLERGHLTEFGVRKLLAVLSVLGMELEFRERGMAGYLDELRRERGGS